MLMTMIAPLNSDPSSSQTEDADEAHLGAVPIESLLQEFGDSLSQFGNLAPDGSEGKWTGVLVLECAKAISSKSDGRVQHLLWILNELASPYGDCEQRLAFYFLQALFCKMSGSGLASQKALCLAMERSSSFDSMRKTILKFQEVSPWTTFGHVACNGAILEAFDGESKVHILDMSNTFCTQWPTLLEALATRPDGAPSLRLSTIILSHDTSSMKVMKEVGARLERFARLMGVPFEFKVHHEMNMDKLHDHEKLSSLLDLQSGEALAINCNLALHQVSTKVETLSSNVNTNIEPIEDGRDRMLQNFQRMNPKILTLIEEEADMVPQDFLHNISESLRFYSLYFETLQVSFPKISEERLILERIVGRNVLNLLACTPSYDVGHEESQGSVSAISCEKRETSVQWGERLTKSGFKVSPFSEDVMDDVRALIKRYKEGWSLDSNQERTCVHLNWKDQKTVFSSTWKC
ncbi:hypothetical protein GOP47_0013680 [Adiantum capillus-veneris]|uniref:Protein SHORT-ROOT-like n=1 Tax=Adiantum capillus-veneris TaxID=13818 RepID=A0A9D4UPI0_ADICA|nr:hypothetical protein GOP47_0013680 [Adiantum capillus-veneris]